MNIRHRVELNEGGTRGIHGDADAATILHPAARFVFGAASRLNRGSRPASEHPT
jgi:hypothetical protein